MRFLVRGGLVVEGFEGVKSTGAGVTLPAFTFGCQIEAPQCPLCPGLYPQLQVLVTGIALQVPPNRLLLLLTTFQERMEKISGVLGGYVVILLGTALVASQSLACKAIESSYKL